jgi:hypothetical protein
MAWGQAAMICISRSSDMARDLAESSLLFRPSMTRLEDSRVNMRHAGEL